MDTVLNRDISLLKPYPLFFLGLVSIVSYVPGITGAAVPTTWFIFLLIIPLFVMGLNLNLSWGFGFICYTTLSLLWSSSFNIGLFYLSQIIVLGCVFIIGLNTKDLTPIFKGLGIGLGIGSLLAIAQYFGFKEVYSLGGEPASFFVNKNIYSEISAILLVSFAIYKLWWFIPTALPGLILVQSRTAYLALGFGLFIWSWNYNKKLAFSLLVSVGVIGLYFYHGSFQIGSMIERLNMWADTIQGLVVFGHGVGSYEAMFPYYATHIDTELARPKFAHNDILQLIFEFGIGSILILMVLFNVLNSKRKEAIIVWIILLVSMFTYPFHLPTAAFIALIVSGHVVGVSTSRNLWIDWRSILFKRFEAKQSKLANNS